MKDDGRQTTMEGWETHTREMEQVVIVRALRAFVQTLRGDSECSHSKVDAAHAGGFCQDCGYQVRMEWVMLHCRQCQAKRIPQQTMWNGIQPLHAFCRHCGHDGFRLVRKPSIEVYELMYAIGTKTTVYTEGPAPAQPPIRNPFQTTRAAMADVILDAEVLNRREYRSTKSAFKTAPMNYQTRQNPRRYGADPDVETKTKVVPLLRQGV